MSRNAKTFAAGLAGGLARGYMMKKLLEKEAELKALKKGQTPEAAPAGPPAEPAAMPTAGVDPAVTSPVPDQSIEVTELPPMQEVAPPPEPTAVAEAADFSDAWSNDFPPPDMPVEPFVSAVG